MLFRSFGFSGRVVSGALVVTGAEHPNIFNVFLNDCSPPLVSDAFGADISVRTSRKLFIFIVEVMFTGSMHCKAI